MFPKVLRLSMILIYLSLSLSACPGGETPQKLENQCQTVGARCRLKPGVLGVCSPANPTAQVSSKLMCTPQH